VKKNIFFVVLLVFGVSYLPAKFLNSLVIEYSNFQQIEQNIYIDSNFEKSEVQNLKTLILDVKQRINNKFGELLSSPVVIISKIKEESLKCGNSVGLSYISPFKDYVVIGYKGLNIDVIAHELLHVETAYRLGYITRQFKFPIWVDEGISMQVDYRKKYDLEILNKNEIKRIQTLNSVNSFFGQDQQQVVKNYQGAKYVMAKILQQYPNRSLFKLLQEIKDGKKIEEVFYLKLNKVL